MTPMIGVFDHHTGTARYDAAAQTYTLHAPSFAWKRRTGAFLLTADAAGRGEGAFGWTVRASLDADVPFVALAVRDGQAMMQVRRTAGGELEEQPFAATSADVLRLERSADGFALSAARRGEVFETHEVQVELPGELYVGLFAESGGAVFHNVRVTVPAPTDFVPYEDYIGSRLEVLDVATGRRAVVYSTPKNIEAPNWTPDGRALIYNSGGLLYRFDLEGRTPEILPTGFATRNNNDHVLSPDGTQLGISHHAEDANGQSIIYTLPAEGGTPRRVTERGPSYLHAWSPDGRYLVYTAGRDGSFDIYRIPVEGGEEERLTASDGLDDGPEYTPDGAWIYFNSSRTGRMQLWRMQADGSEQQQVTEDAFNNWFPHPSPDGRQLVFLSYPSSVEADDHPYYERVYLRLMPMEGGTPRVLGYVYGGQGTINVPSWSPGGQQVAFVSHTG